MILSGPSGSGKSTIIARLLDTSTLPLRLSVSATTRTPRPGERHGVEYYFWDHDRFRAALDRGEFLEHAEVHGNCYGTLRSEVDPYRERGIGVILDIDVQGADQIRRLYPDHVSVFLRAPSGEVYAQRLRKRGTEDEATIHRRIEGARGELARAAEYHYVIDNDELDAAVSRLNEILRDTFSRG